jgi:hypothetical protein
MLELCMVVASVVVVGPGPVVVGPVVLGPVVLVEGVPVVGEPGPVVTAVVETPPAPPLLSAPPLLNRSSTSVEQAADRPSNEKKPSATGFMVTAILPWRVSIR